MVVVSAVILGSDAKRIHASLQLACEGRAEPAAAAEIMLLHVQQAQTPAAAPFPAAIARAIDEFREQSAGPISVPGSRRIELRSRR